VACTALHEQGELNAGCGAMYCDKGSVSATSIAKLHAITFGDASSW
jgi:hypothetical protein